VRVPHKLPVVLSKEEVARLIGAVGHIKHQTALSLAYGTGLPVDWGLLRRAAGLFLARGDLQTSGI
jgi:integrase